MKLKITLTLFTATVLLITSCSTNSADNSVKTPEQKAEPAVQEVVKTPEQIQAEEKAQAEQKLKDAKEFNEKVQAEAQDDKIREKLKAQAKRDWPDDYTTQEYWINQEMVDYEYMKTIPNDDRIKMKAQQDWPLDFTTQKYWYDEQIQAKERLK